MSIQSEITRLTTAKNTIKTKLVELKLVESTAKLDTCATAISGITNQGSVSAEVKEGETYTIPKGYHDGSGTISGVAGGGNYALQSKTATPTKAKQTITPDSGKYGLSDVIVNPIPENYQDVSAVTAAAADVLANKIFVDSEGNNVTGTMANNGTVSKTLDTTTTSYTVPKGYHSGSGKVSITTETKTTTPTKLAQNITPTSGKVLSKVTVDAIPEIFQDVTGVTATPDTLLVGKTAIGTIDDSKGNLVKNEIVGTMANNGDQVITIHQGNVDDESTIIKQGYHAGEGYAEVVSIQMSATPTKSTQTIIPSENSSGQTPFLTRVIVQAIPDKYQDVSGVTVTAADILTGKKAMSYNSNTGAAVEITGTMANNGKVTTTIDGLTTTSYTIPAGYHNGTGTVSLTSDIEELLAAI